MSGIKISSDQIGEIPKGFMQENEQSQGMIKGVEGSFQKLQPRREAASQQRLYSEYDNWKISMNQFVELLGGVSKEIDVVAEKFEQRDKLR